MTIKDFLLLKEKIDTSDCFGSDTSIGNLFILQDRYKIQMQIKDTFLLREYDYSESIRGFSYPLIIGNKGESSLNVFLSEITKNFTKNQIQLCLFTEQQKNELDRFLKENKLPYKIEWKNNPADSDYIYLQNNLSLLSGKKLQKKRNHISQFYRRFENISFRNFDRNNYSKTLYEDFVAVAEAWNKEQSEVKEEALLDYNAEVSSMKAALDNIMVFDFAGGILYVNEEPVAITLASKISDKVLDIHFEKCLSEAASFGGYAVINNLFIKQYDRFQYINREEDLGIEGLRKAKLSYKPAIILKKYYGVLTKD